MTQETLMWRFTQYFHFPNPPNIQPTHARKLSGLTSLELRSHKSTFLHICQIDTPISSPLRQKKMDWESPDEHFLPPLFIFLKIYSQTETKSLPSLKIIIFWTSIHEPAVGHPNSQTHCCWFKAKKFIDFFKKNSRNVSFFMLGD